MNDLNFYKSEIKCPSPSSYYALLTAEKNNSTVHIFEKGFGSDNNHWSININKLIPKKLHKKIHSSAHTRKRSAGLSEKSPISKLLLVQPSTTADVTFDTSPPPPLLQLPVALSLVHDARKMTTSRTPSLPPSAKCSMSNSLSKPTPSENHMSHSQSPDYERGDSMYIYSHDLELELDEKSPLYSPASASPSNEFANNMFQIKREYAILKQKYELQAIEMNKLKQENMRLVCKVNHLTDELTKFKKKRYVSWTSNDIVEWILSLENGRFAKYNKKKKLLKSLTKEGVNGIQLAQINEWDLKGYGISKFDDKKCLIQHIRKLITTEGQ